MKNNSLLYLLSIFIVVFLLSISLHISHKKMADLSYTPQPALDLSALSQPTKQNTPKALQGKMYLLNVWASWCPACRSEHSILMTIKEQYLIPIYGVNFKDNIENATLWLKKEGDPYVTIESDTNGTIAADLGIDGIPQTFLIDQRGIIRYRFKGALDRDTWENTLLPLVNQLTHEQ